jgi:hypothetical protein
MGRSAHQELAETRASIVRRSVRREGLEPNRTDAVLAVYPGGIGRRGLHRWQTRPMTKELADELARVRAVLAHSNEPTRPASMQTSTLHAATPAL